MNRGENRHKLIRFSLFFFLLVMQLSGCGMEETGSPGSWGAEDTNTIVRAELSLETPSVDICNGADSGAKANLTLETVNTDLPENRLYLEGYSIKFTALASGAPEIEDGTVHQTAALPASDLPVLFVDAGRKAKYVADITTGGKRAAEDFPSYVAEYAFYGKDGFGADFGAVATATFRIGKYSGCEMPLQVQPASISLSAIADPEDDPSDDITFHISGGAGPYAVYSDNTAVIPHPGALGAGVASFTVDPQAVAATVTLTVVDSKGAAVTALVTVTP